MAERAVLLDIEAELRRLAQREVDAQFPVSYRLFGRDGQVKAFDESQERDERGRWVAVGGGGGSTTISVKPEDRAEIDRHVTAAVGHTLSDEKLAALVGAPPGSKVTIVPHNDRYFPGVAIIAEHPDIEDQAVAILQERTQTPRDKEEGRWSPTELHYEQVFLKPEARGKGTGVRMMADAVEAAHQAGIKTVTLTAAGAGPKSKYPGHAEGEQGYYVWPRLGFDGKVDQVGTDRKSWPEPYRGAEKLSDLMKMPGGAQHWKEYGDEPRLSIDTDPKSPGRQVMDAYLAHRGL